MNIKKIKQIEKDDERILASYREIVAEIKRIAQVLDLHQQYIGKNKFKETKELAPLIKEIDVLVKELIKLRIMLAHVPKLREDIAFLINALNPFSEKIQNDEFKNGREAMHVFDKFIIQDFRTHLAKDVEKKIKGDEELRMAA